MLDRLDWFTPAGDQWPLYTAVGVRTEEGPDGRFMPPFALDTRVDQDRERVTGARAKLRTITVPLAFDTWFSLFPAGAEATRSLLRSVALAFDPTIGDGRLRTQTFDDDDALIDEREIVCRYAGGFEIDDALATSSLEDYRAPVKFVGGPYWRACTDTVEQWSPGQPVTFFPIFPIRLSASEVFANEPVTNVGDVDAWPTWSITGPGDSLVVRNVTTGRMFAWSGSLGVGERLTIDTDAKTVVDNAGANRFAELTSWDFWPLVHGTQTVQIELADTTADSLVACSHRPHWLTA